jgi:hypothetical protein
MPKPFTKRTFLDSGTVNLTTGTQQQQIIELPNEGDLKEFLIEVAATAAGTLTGANKLSEVIDSIKITDRNGDPVFSNVKGKHLKTRHFFGNLKAITESTVSASTQTDTYSIPIRVDQSRYPVFVQITFAAYSALATSGATAGTGRVRVTGMYLDDPNDRRTERWFIRTKSLASGVQNIAPDIIKDTKILATYLQFATEADLTDVTFSRDGALELDQWTVTQFTGFDNAKTISGHQTGLFSLYHDPYVATAKTRFDMNMSSSEDVDFHFFSEDLPGK